MAFFVISDSVSTGKHPLVQDARNQNAPGIGPVEDDMPSVLQATQSGTKVITGSTRFTVVGKHLATSPEIGKIADRLIHTPGS